VRTPGTPDEASVARVLALVESVTAPPALHASIRAERDRRASRRTRLRAWAAGGAVAVALVALAAALVVVLAPASGPSVLDAAALAGRGPEAPAPARDPADPDALALSVEGVAFPAWSEERWRATGKRSDTLEGRRAATVYYSGAGAARLAYTIVGGGALEWPEGSRRTVRDGLEVRLLRRPGGVVATWREQGHQCVISAPASVPDGVVLTLATRAGGRSSPGYGAPAPG
jgi:hypothetical protein